MIAAAEGRDRLGYLGVRSTPRPRGWRLDPPNLLDAVAVMRSWLMQLTRGMAFDAMASFLPISCLVSE